MVVGALGNERKLLKGQIVRARYAHNIPGIKHHGFSSKAAVGFIKSDKGDLFHFFFAPGPSDDMDIGDDVEFYADGDFAQDVRVTKRMQPKYG